MVEVFKTNVGNWELANWLVAQIHRQFGHYKANFDLEDCDKILRIKSVSGTVELPCLLKFLKEYGVLAEVLPD